MTLLQRFVSFFNINTMLYMAVILVISLPFHEFAHAVTAHWLGDDTAKRAGRLTLNPIRHLDVIGSICLILCGFGWAKPTPVNPLNFKNRKGGMAITALAGPVSNLLLAFVSELIFIKFFHAAGGVVPTFLYYMTTVNIGLAIFNLIPVSPLDGSRILALVLPESVEMAMYRYEQWFMIGVMLLVFAGVLNGPIGFLANNFYNNFNTIINALPF